jgi:hypothetical protein
LYRVEVSEAARSAIDALPIAAAAALPEVWTVLATAPWSSPPQHKDNPDGAVCRLLFGPAGAGQTVYLISRQPPWGARVGADLARRLTRSKQHWHLEIHRGCQHIPVADYVGNFRGTRRLHIDRYEVRFGPFRGVPAINVADALAVFERQLRATLDRFDAEISTPAQAKASALSLLLESAAEHYAEWLRIHPFADGNGRTARVLLNWMMARYWQPLILPGRPPVDKTSLLAATAPALDPVAPDHRALVRLLRRRLTDARRAANNGP